MVRSPRPTAQVSSPFHFCVYEEISVCWLCYHHVLNWYFHDQKLSQDLGDCMGQACLDKYLCHDTFPLVITHFGGEKERWNWISPRESAPYHLWNPASPWIPQKARDWNDHCFFRTFLNSKVAENTLHSVELGIREEVMVKLLGEIVHGL